MEAVMLSSSLDKSVSPFKQMKNPERVARGFGSNPIESLAPTNNVHGGLLFAPPPPLFSSCPPSASASLMNHHLFRHHQPPLFPLPPSQPLHNSLLTRSRSLSSSLTNRKSNRTRDQSLTPKKSKSKPLTSKGEEQKKDLKPVEATKEAKESTIGFGPDPNDLPKNMLKVLSSPSLRLIESNVVMSDLETFSGSVFTLSPPPSSLPMPKFSLRPKLSCNAEAAGIDAGATDDLRRLLRIC